MVIALFIISAILFGYGYFQSKSGGLQQGKDGKDVDVPNVPITSCFGFWFGLIVGVFAIIGIFID